jgi:hypothetical protein
LEDTTNDTIAKINELIDKHAARSNQRPLFGKKGPVEGGGTDGP